MTKLIKTTICILGMLLIGLAALLVTAVSEQNEPSTVRQVRITPLLNAPPQAINELEARAIALRTIEGSVSEVELNDENGRAVYSVEITRDGAEHELRIDASTGQVLSTEIELDKKQAGTQGISEQEAIEIARKYAKGTLEEVELESFQGRTVYAVEFEYGDEETEVKVDAETGAIAAIEVEIEEDDDDDDDDDD